MNVGIIGLGFMGKMHLNCYQNIDSATVTAICDIDPKAFEGSGTAGNIAGAEAKLDLSGIARFNSIDDFLGKADVEAVSIALPTSLHAEATVKAFAAGKHVLCEKPMALDADQCKDIISAANKAGKILQIGHCIRFWPAYAHAAKLVKDNTYGPLYAATFRRLSCTPTWSSNNWMMDPAQGGTAAFDLHVHDTDFVQYILGMPKAVFARKAKGYAGEFDHIVCQYIYDAPTAVTAEGGWVCSNSFGFQMSFDLIFEKATVNFDITRPVPYRICPADGDAFEPKLEDADGYLLELKHFVKTIRGQTTDAILTPEDSMKSIELVLAEMESAKSGKIVTL